MRKCSKKGCFASATKRALCNRHYEEYRRDGAFGLCSVKGCEQGVIGKGFCKKHLWRFNVYKDPNYLRYPKKGNVRHPNYNAWRGMIQRCHMESSCSPFTWEIYGKRGIKVCAHWRHDFWAFVEDVGIKPLGCSIDRIDNNK